MYVYIYIYIMYVICVYVFVCIYVYVCVYVYANDSNNKCVNIMHTTINANTSNEHDKHNNN